MEGLRRISVASRHNDQAQLTARGMGPEPYRHQGPNLVNNLRELGNRTHAGKLTLSSGSRQGPSPADTSMSAEGLDCCAWTSGSGKDKERLLF